MKKLAILFAVIFLLTACGPAASNTPSPSPEQTATPEPTPATTPVPTPEPTPVQAEADSDEDNSSDVEIIFPSSLYGDMDLSGFDTDEYAAENGFKKAVVNSDNSVTVTMTQAKHEELMADMEGSILEVIDGLLEEDYILDITYTEHFRSFTVSVEKAGYEDAAFDLTGFLLGMTAMTYQMFLNEEAMTEITTLDLDTGEILNVELYPDDSEDEE